MPRPRNKYDLILKSGVAETATSAEVMKLTGGDDVARLEELRPPPTGGVHVQGLEGADAITGTAFDDVIVMTSAKFSVDDGGGSFAPKSRPVIRVDAARPEETGAGNGGDDLVIGGSGNDRLYGDFSPAGGVGVAGDDYLLGLGGDDMLDGGDGNDSLDGGLGNNLLNGGDGTDTVTWAAILKRDVWTRAVGVVVNLSGEDLVLGNDNPTGRMTLTDLAGGVVGTAGRLINNKHPDLMEIADGAAGKLERDDTGGPLATYDTLTGIERFEGSVSANDVAVLDAAFVLVGTDADGWSAYSDGTTTQWLRGFEHVFFA